MNAKQSRDAAKFDREITIAYRIHRVLCDLRLALGIDKSKQFRDQFPVERETGSGNGAAAERTNVPPLKATLQPLPIALQHLHVCQEVMRQEDRLRTLQMRVAGDNHPDLTCPQFHQR